MVVFSSEAPEAVSGLGIDANTVTRQAPRKPSAHAIRELRRVRFRRRDQSRSWLLDDAAAIFGADRAVSAVCRPGKCGFARAAEVGVHKAPAEGAHARYSGLMTCASIWACPSCSSIIRARRADEVRHASQWWETGQSGSFLFATFTLRHKLHDSLKDSMTALTGAFTRLIRGAPWKRFAARLGIAHMIKTVEVTLSWRNGWHAHLHVLWFTSEQASARALADARGWLSARWADMVVKEGGRRPSADRGVTVRRVQDGAIVADYITKLQEHDQVPRRWDIGQEMTRIDAKKGRLESMVPFDLLDVDGADDDEVERQRAAWVEYVEVTRGRRAMTWSRGLKDACGLDDVDDDEILDDAEAEAAEEQIVLTIRREHWRGIQRQPDVVARILDLVEQGREHEVAELVPIRLRT